MSVRFRAPDGSTVTLPGPLDDPTVWESLLEKIAAGQEAGTLGPMPAWLVAAAQERHPAMKLSKDTYDAIRAGASTPLLIPELVGAAPPDTAITPAQFNRVVAQETEELEAFEPVLRRQYERIIRRLGREMAERFRELAKETPALAAAYDPNQPRDPGGEGGGQWVRVSGSDDERLLPADDEYTQLVRGARMRVHDDDTVHQSMRGLEGVLEATQGADNLVVRFPSLGDPVFQGSRLSVNRRDIDMVAHPGSPGDERVQTAMRVWRSDFSSSLALKALIEGREPAPAYRGKDYVELAQKLNEGLEHAGSLSQTAFRIVPGDPPQVGGKVKFTAAAAGIDRGMVEEYRTTFLTGHEKPTVFLIPPDAKALYYPDGQEAIVRGDFTVDEVNWSEERKVWEAKLRSSHSLTSAGVFREEMVRRWPTGTKVAGPAGGGRFAPKELKPTSRQSSAPDKPWERDIRHQLAEHFKKKGVFDAYGTADRIMPYGKEFMLAELKPKRTNVKYGHVTSFVADVVLLFPGSKIDVVSGQEVPSAKGKMPAELRYTAPLSKAGKPLKTKTTITRKTPPPSPMTSAAPPPWNPPTVAELLRTLLDDAVTIMAGPTATQRKVFQTTVDGILRRLGLSFDVRSVIAQAILNGLAARSEGILEGVRTPVARIIANSYLNGLSVPQTAEAIQEGVDGLAGWQATQLARNDLVGMANGGSLLAAKMVNEKFPGAAGTYKQWLATDDERTRPSHNEAHGQRVPLESAFVVGGAHLDYPGDPTGPDGEVINCRCTIIYFSEPKPVLTAAAREYVRYPKGTEVGPTGTGPGGGRFAPVQGEEAFTPEAVPADAVEFSEALKAQNDAWYAWDGETQFQYGEVADKHWQYSMIAGELVPPDDAAIAKIAVQNQIAAKLEGDEDFKSLIRKLDPIGAYKTDFEEGGKFSSADTVEKQVAALATQTWARTSGDSDEISLQFQIAAEQEFGLEANPFVHQEFEEMMADYADEVPGAVNTPRWTDTEMAGAKKFLRAQYELTQEKFEKAGIKEMILFRGMAWSPKDVPAEIETLRDARVKQTGVIAVHGNPLSSWSRSFTVAHTFTTKYDVKALAGTKVDVRRILSTPFTGFGCLDESEVVVLGGRDMDAMTWTWNNSYFLDDETMLNPLPGPVTGIPGQDSFVKEWQKQIAGKP